MELVCEYVGISNKRKMQYYMYRLKSNDKSQQQEEKLEVDLGDLIQKLKVEIDQMLGR